MFQLTGHFPNPMVFDSTPAQKIFRIPSPHPSVHNFYNCPVGYSGTCGWSFFSIGVGGSRKRDKAHY